MQRAQASRREARIRIDALPAQGPQPIGVGAEAGLILRQQAEQPPLGQAAGGQPVVHPLAVAEPFEQPGAAELLQVLRHPRLALPEHLGKLADGQLPLPAQRHDAQALGIAERFETLPEQVRGG